MAEFTHELFGTLRTVEIDGDVWFLLTDVAKSLGYTKVDKAKNHLDDSQFNTPNRSIRADLGFSRGRLPIVINESGLYQLVMRSDKPEAKKFQLWITDEVLPSLRSKGSYSMQEDDAPTWARELMTKVDVLSTLAKAHNEVQETSKGYSLAETARRMGIPPRRFNAILRELGIVTQPDNIPTGFGREMGYVARRGNTAAVPESGYEGLRVAVT